MTALLSILVSLNLNAFNVNLPRITYSLNESNLVYLYGEPQKLIEINHAFYDDVCPQWRTNPDLMNWMSEHEVKILDCGQCALFLVDKNSTASFLYLKRRYKMRLDRQ